MKYAVVSAFIARIIAFQASAYFKKVTAHYLNKAFGQNKCPYLNHIVKDNPYLGIGPNDDFTGVHAPNESIPAITALLPGMKSPTVLPLSEPGWSSLHSVVREDLFWSIIDELKKLGAEGILVTKIEKMIFYVQYKGL